MFANEAIPGARFCAPRNIHQFDLGAKPYPVCNVVHARTLSQSGCSFPSPITPCCVSLFKSSEHRCILARRHSAETIRVQPQDHVPEVGGAAARL